MSRSRPVRWMVWAVCLVTGLFILWGAYSVVAQETLDERRDRIAKLDATRKAELERAREKFAALDPAERRRLHDLHTKIENHPRPDDLWDVMTQYCEWTKSLSMNDRDQLRALEPAERIEKIKELRRKQAEAKKAGRFGMRGSGLRDRFKEMIERERDGLIRWIDGYMGQSRPAAALIDDLPEPQREQLSQAWKKLGNDPAARRKLFARVWVRWQLANPSKGFPLDDDALAKLRAELSSQTNQWLEPMPRDHQRRFLAGLISAFLFIHNIEELGEYLAKELTGEQRDWITSLPPEQMQQELWRVYIRSKFPSMSSRRPGGPWSRGPHGQPPRGSRGPSRGPQSGGPPPDGAGKDRRFGPGPLRERSEPRR